MKYTLKSLTLALTGLLLSAQAIAAPLNYEPQNRTVTQLVSSSQVSATNVSATSATLGALQLAGRPVVPNYIPVSRRAPNACDDNTKGYVPGNNWHNVATKQIWRMTNSDTCAAMWEEIPNLGLTLVGDAISTTALRGAWGVSQLKSAYNGPLLSLLRTTDSSITSIYTVSGTYRLDEPAAKTFMQGGNGRFARFYDQAIGTSNDMSQTVTANMPWLSTNGPSNQAGAMFTGLTGTGLTTAQWMDVSTTLTGNANNAAICWVGTMHNSASGGYNGGVNTVYQLGYPSYLLAERTISRYGRVVNPTIVGGMHMPEFQQARSINCTSFAPAATGLISIANDASSTYLAQYGTSGFTGLRFGNTTENSTSPGSMSDVQAIWYYNAGLTDAQLDAVRIAAYRQFDIVPQARTILHAIGDSITAGQSAVSNTNYAGEAAQQLGEGVTVYNWGSSGDSVQNWANGTGSAQYVANNFKPKANNIVSIMLATNDFTFGISTSPTQSVTSITTLIGYLRSAAAASGTTIKVVVGTIPPRTVSGNNMVYINQANTLIRNGATGADAIVDFASDTIIGGQNSVTNTTIFADGVHPTRYGQKRMGSLLFNVIKQWAQ